MADDNICKYMGVVTFLDVMGWKGIWTRKENNAAIEDLREVVNEIEKKAGEEVKKIINPKAFGKSEKRDVKKFVESLIKSSMEFRAKNKKRINIDMIELQDITKEFRFNKEQATKILPVLSKGLMQLPPKELSEIYDEINSSIYNKTTMEEYVKIVSISDTIAILSTLSSETENNASSDKEIDMHEKLPTLSNEIENNASLDKEINIHGKLCKAAISKALDCGLLLRGATSYGEFYVEDNIFVGPAVDELGLWYEASKWVGVIMTPSARYECERKTYQSDEETPFNLDKDCWVEYSAPLEKGKIPTYCVNWCNGNFQEDYRKLLDVFRETKLVDGPINIKYQNTLEFCKYVAKNQKVIPKKNDPNEREQINKKIYKNTTKTNRLLHAITNGKNNSMGVK